MNTYTDCNELVRHCKCGRFGVRHNDTNNGFWDRPAEERAERMRAAADIGGVENFFDLTPEERANAYDA